MMFVLLQSMDGMPVLIMSPVNMYLTLKMVRYIIMALIPFLYTLQRIMKRIPGFQFLLFLCRFIILLLTLTGLLLVIYPEQTLTYIHSFIDSILSMLSRFFY